MDAMRAYAWPGNVRELRNAVERAVVLGRSDEVLVADLGLPGNAESRAPTPQLQTLKEAEQNHILWVLKQCGGNKTQACRILQIGRATLYSKLGGLPGMDGAEHQDS
jgi:DNA-binding NtrC family response regulator